MGKPFGCLLAVGCFDEDGQICILYGLNQPGAPRMAGSFLSNEDNLIFSSFHPLVADSVQGDERQPGQVFHTRCSKPVQMLAVVGSSYIVEAFGDQ